MTAKIKPPKLVHFTAPSGAKVRTFYSRSASVAHHETGTFATSHFTGVPIRVNVDEIVETGAVAISVFGRRHDGALDVGLFLDLEGVRRLRDEINDYLARELDEKLARMWRAAE